MKRLKDVRPFPRAEAPAPDERTIEALRRAETEALDREQWRALLERILALSNELHPATRYGLKREAERLWQRLELGPIPPIQKTERVKLRERSAQHRHLHSSISP